MARDGEDDGRIMAQSQSITGGRLICSRDGGGGPAFLQGEQTTKLLALPPDSPTRPSSDGSLPSWSTQSQP